MMRFGVGPIATLSLARARAEARTHERAHSRVVQSPWYKEAFVSSTSPVASEAVTGDASANPVADTASDAPAAPAAGLDENPVLVGNPEECQAGALLEGSPADATVEDGGAATAVVLPGEVKEVALQPTPGVPCDGGGAAVPLEARAEEAAAKGILNCESGGDAGEKAAGEKAAGEGGVALAPLPSAVPQSSDLAAAAAQHLTAPTPQPKSMLPPLAALPEPPKIRPRKQARQ